MGIEFLINIPIFHLFKHIIMLFLAFTIYYETFTVYLIFFSLKAICPFIFIFVYLSLLIVFKDPFLVFDFCVFIAIYMSIDFFVFILIFAFLNLGKGSIGSSVLENYLPLYFQILCLSPFFLSFPSGIFIGDIGCLLYISWGFLFFFNDYLFIEFLLGSFKTNLVLLLHSQLFHCGFHFLNL